MDIFTYLGQNKMSKREFSRLIGITEHHFYRILMGKRLPSAVFALKVEETTGGKVKAENFLYDIIKLYKETVKK